MTGTLIDRETFTITFERTVRASPEEVFDAWTRPEQIAEWWDPSGARLVECQVDLRPGGAFHFASAGQPVHFTGTYAVVEHPSRLSFDALGSLGLVTIEPMGAMTRMRVTICCASPEHFDRMIQLGVAANTGRTLDNLVAHLDGRASERLAP